MTVSDGETVPEVGRLRAGFAPRSEMPANRCLLAIVTISSTGLTPRMVSFGRRNRVEIATFPANRASPAAKVVQIAGFASP
jgi:hypothetical protein